MAISHQRRGIQRQLRTHSWRIPIALIHRGDNGPGKRTPEPWLPLALLNQGSDHIDRLCLYFSLRTGRGRGHNLLFRRQATFCGPQLLLQAFTFRRSNDCRRGLDLVSLSPGNLLRIREATALLPALICRSTTARSSLTRKRLRKILRTPRARRHGNHGAANAQQHRQADQPGCPLQSSFPQP